MLNNSDLNLINSGLDWQLTWKTFSFYLNRKLKNQDFFYLKYWFTTHIMAEHSITWFNSKYIKYYWRSGPTYNSHCWPSKIYILNLIILCYHIISIINVSMIIGQYYVVYWFIMVNIFCIYNLVLLLCQINMVY